MTVESMEGLTAALEKAKAVRNHAERLRRKAEAETREALARVAELEGALRQANRDCSNELACRVANQDAVRYLTGQLDDARSAIIEARARAYHAGWHDGLDAGVVNPVDANADADYAVWLSAHVKSGAFR
jgi:kynureninase